MVSHSRAKGVRGVGTVTSFRGKGGCYNGSVGALLGKDFTVIRKHHRTVLWLQITNIYTVISLLYTVRNLRNTSSLILVQTSTNPLQVRPSWQSVWRKTST